MRDCANGELRDQLPDWVHGRLDAARAEVVAQHVAACADCADEVALLRDLGTTLRAGAPQVDVARIVAALPKPPARGRATLRWYQRTQWRAAAAVVLMVGASSIALLDRGAPDAPKAAMEFAGGVSDLSEGDLQSLLKDLEKMDATPQSEPDGAQGVSAELGPVAP
ncbi:MAG: zf-HC2 domain-containing protein [Gemmatimonadetes bacterium]|nr:zf-HC2 domain-containing protein [Gemmatimonadota bacterium]